MPFIYWPYIRSILKKSLSIAKKIAIVIGAYVVIFSLFYFFTNKDRAANQQIYSNNNFRAQIYQIINPSDANTDWGGKISIKIFRFSTCWLLGEGCTDNPADGNYYSQHSLISTLSGIISAPFAYPPASGVYWAYSGLENAGFIPKTYAAQGIGFAALGSYQQIWKIFRNFTMLLLVLVIVAIGFMIMFRAKINPQTVISIENSLPKIVIALILITFSFAIAGFLIDLMYIVIGMIVLLLHDSFNSNILGVNKATDFYNNSSKVWQFMHPFQLKTLFLIATSLTDLLPNWIKTLLDSVLAGVSYNFLMNVFVGIAAGGGAGAAAKATAADTKELSALAKNLKAFTIPSLLSNLAKIFKNIKVFENLSNKIGSSGTLGLSTVFAVIAVVINIIVTILLTNFALQAIITVLLVLSLTLIFFRIFFMLISNYVNIIIAVIFSPIVLALEAIPGRSTFSSWIKNLIINLSTFPIFILLVFIARIIIYSPSTDTPAWRAPFLTDLNLPLETIVGGFILFSIPDIISGFKKMLGVKPLMPFEIGLGAFFAGVGAGVGGVEKGVGFTTSLATFPLIGNIVRESGVWKGLVQKGIIPKTQPQLFGEEVTKQLEPLLPEKPKS